MATEKKIERTAEMDSRGYRLFSQSQEVSHKFTLPDLNAKIDQLEEELARRTADLTKEIEALKVIRDEAQVIQAQADREEAAAAPVVPSEPVSPEPVVEAPAAAEGEPQ